MAWTTPSTLTTNTLVTAAVWNQQVTNNLAVLGGHGHTGAAGDGAALGAAPSGLIGVFDTDCPAGWTRVSALDNRIIRGAASYSTGSTDTHTHTDAGHTHSGAHTHGIGTFGQAAYADVTASKGAGATNVSADHHIHYTSGTSGVQQETVTGAGIQSDSTLPPYIAVIFCKRN